MPAINPSSSPTPETGVRVTKYYLTLTVTLTVSLTLTPSLTLTLTLTLILAPASQGVEGDTAWNRLCVRQAIGVRV